MSYFTRNSNESSMGFPAFKGCIEELPYDQIRVGDKFEHGRYMEIVHKWSHDGGYWIEVKYHFIERPNRTFEVNL